MAEMLILLLIICYFIGALVTAVAEHDYRILFQEVFSFLKVFVFLAAVVGIFVGKVVIITVFAMIFLIAEFR